MSDPEVTPGLLDQADIEVTPALLDAIEQRCADAVARGYYSCMTTSGVTLIALVRRVREQQERLDQYTNGIVCVCAVWAYDDLPDERPDHHPACPVATATAKLRARVRELEAERDRAPGGIARNRLRRVP